MRADRRVWRMSWGVRIGVLVVAAMIAGLMWLAVDHAASGNPDTPWPVAVIVTIVGGGFLLLGYRVYFHARVVLRGSELEVRNPLRTVLVDVRRVRKIQIGSSGSELMLSDGTTISAWAIQKGAAAQLLRRNARADRAVRAILAARDATRSADSGGGGVGAR